ncbi:hypothetical protein BV25DRAFT_1919793 [Artomyces pyxidatus]|uniref:Uncharacterized protein n=1 Tax=Artomyces pyxidatus TaxID=48021 RepID=A0ACB8SNZ3_9AGAM|nr:hypothetical protein BV25DRAFT_1919793 [Artomyces pyxidatus]
MPRRSPESLHVINSPISMRAATTVDEVLYCHYWEVGGSKELLFPTLSRLTHGSQGFLVNYLSTELAYEAAQAGVEKAELGPDNRKLREQCFKLLVDHRGRLTRTLENANGPMMSSLSLLRSRMVGGATMERWPTPAETRAAATDLLGRQIDGALHANELWVHSGLRTPDGTIIPDFMGEGLWETMRSGLYRDLDAVPRAIEHRARPRTMFYVSFMGSAPWRCVSIYVMATAIASGNWFLLLQSGNNTYQRFDHEYHAAVYDHFVMQLKAIESVEFAQMRLERTWQMKHGLPFNPPAAPVAAPAAPVAAPAAPVAAPAAAPVAAPVAAPATAPGPFPFLGYMF